jgi:hypothetical protein
MRASRTGGGRLHRRLDSGPAAKLITQRQTQRLPAVELTPRIGEQGTVFRYSPPASMAHTSKKYFGDDITARTNAGGHVESTSGRKPITAANPARTREVHSAITADVIISALWRNSVAGRVLEAA